jgi:hypothetical protein
MIEDCWCVREYESLKDVRQGWRRSLFGPDSIMAGNVLL